MSDSLLKPEDNNFDHMFLSVPFSPELDANPNFFFCYQVSSLPIHTKMISASTYLQQTRVLPNRVVPSPLRFLRPRYRRFIRTTQHLG